MTIFECARCNEMKYSASAGAITACDSCGSDRQRVIDGDFNQARQSLRTLGPGDHATLVYEDATAIAPFCARFLTEGVLADERVVAGLKDDLREEVTELLSPDVEGAVEWEPPSGLYGDFDPDRVAATYGELIRGNGSRTRILAGLDRESAEGVDPQDMERYETLAHEIITDCGATVVCVYDGASLPPEFIDVIADRHGLAIDEGGAVRRNERFEYQPA